MHSLFLDVFEFDYSKGGSMPVHRQKQCTTPNTTDSTEGQGASAVPEQWEFQQYLRELVRGAIRIVLEDVTREELDALIGMKWGESIPKRKGFRTALTPAIWLRPLVGSRS